jgi:hypothetical protein
VKVLTPEKSFAPSAAGAVPKEFRADELRFKTRDDGCVSKEISAPLNEILSYLKTVLIFLIIVTYCFIIKMQTFEFCGIYCVRAYVLFLPIFVLGKLYMQGHSCGGGGGSGAATLDTRVKGAGNWTAKAIF